MSPRPRKRFGQHYLVDGSVLRAIADLCQPGPADLLLEVGPGRGALTRQLLANGLNTVAVEIDRDLVELLGSQLDDERLRLMQGDILQLDFEKLVREEGKTKLFIAGNLPYNISAPFLFKLLEHADLVSRAVLTLQREVAARIVAGPGSRQYGRLSILLGMRAESRICLDVDSAAFRPRPKVSSAVVELRFREHPRCALRHPTAFDSIVRAAFAQRRKMLRNALATLWKNMAPSRVPHGEWPPLETPAESAAINLERRAETLSIEEFAALSEAMAQTAERVSAAAEGRHPQ